MMHLHMGLITDSVKNHVVQEVPYTFLYAI